MSKQSDLVSVSQGASGDPLYIDTTNDRVGIGTSSPTVAGSGYLGLNIYGGTKGPQIKLSNSTTGNTADDGFDLLVLQGGSDAYIWQREAADMLFGTSATERMRIDNAGRVTMPYQPTMLLMGDQNSYASLVTANGVANTVPLNLVVSGNGSGFNTSTHTFTAPVAGNYLISVWGLTTSGTSANELRIFKNGTRLTRSYNDGRGGYGHSIVATLPAGDYIQLVSDLPIYLHQTSPYSGLSITLLS